MNNNKKVTNKFKSQKRRGKARPTRSMNDELGRSQKNDKFTSDEVKTDHYNDVSWYSKNEQMLKDAASFSYNRPLGSEIGATRIFSPNVSPQFNYTANASATSVAGVMNLLTAITPGLSTDYTSPINLAAQNIYSFVRYENSGAKNYEPADLMFYLLSLDSGYAMWNFLKRAYGIARSYNQKNWYYPRVFIESQGIDFDDLMANLSDFRLYLNTMASRLMSFCVPAVMPLFVRHSWMFSNIWKDADNDKAQCYQFIPAYFFQYQEVSTAAGSLQPIQWLSYTANNANYSNQVNPTLKTFAQIKQYADGIINALSMSEDIGVMSGDILKAYGQDKLFKLSPVEADYVCTPTYAEDVLNQIHNAYVCTDAISELNILYQGSWQVTQNVDTQTIVFDPSVPGTGNGRPYVSSALINMPWNDVTPANTMVGTRLTALPGPRPNSTSYSKFKAMGSEVIVTAGISFNNYTGSNSEVEMETYLFRSVAFGAETAAGSFPVLPSITGITEAALKAYTDNICTALYQITNKEMTMAALRHQFDWCPIVYMAPVRYGFDVVGSTQTPGIEIASISAIDCDMSNWTIILNDDLAQMHLTAIMSEFNIPQIGSF